MDQFSKSGSDYHDEMDEPRTRELLLQPILNFGILQNSAVDAYPDFRNFMEEYNDSHLPVELVPIMDNVMATVVGSTTECFAPSVPVEFLPLEMSPMAQETVESDTAAHEHPYACGSERPASGFAPSVPVGFYDGYLGHGTFRKHSPVDHYSSGDSILADEHMEIEWATENVVYDSSVEHLPSASRRPNSAPLMSERSFEDEFLPVHPSVGHRAGCPRECPPADAHMGLPGCALHDPLLCHAHARKREQSSPPEGASGQK